MPLQLGVMEESAAQTTKLAGAAELVVSAAHSVEVVLVELLA